MQRPLAQRAASIPQTWLLILKVCLSEIYILPRQSFCPLALRAASIPQTWLLILKVCLFIYIFIIYLYIHYFLYLFIIY